MKIMLLDDSLRHRRAGKSQLMALGHEVVALCNYTEARRLAETEHFDVALIDLLMPAEAETLGPDAIAQFLNQEIGVGFPMAMQLAKTIPLIAVATDTNHHNHPMSAIVDWFHEPLTVNGGKVLIMHSPMSVDGSKDWSVVLGKLVKKAS